MAETEQSKIDRINNSVRNPTQDELDGLTELNEFVEKDGDVVQKCRGCIYLKKLHCMRPEHVSVPSLPTDPACGYRKDKVYLVPIAEKILGESLTTEEKKT